MPETESAYDRLQRAMAAVPDSARADVLMLHGKAVGYVWGRQDQGLHIRTDGDPSFQFGCHYALMVAEFYAQKRTSYSCIRDEFERWLAALPDARPALAAVA